MADIFLGEVDLGGSWTVTQDVSGSPATVDATEYRDRLVPWATSPAGTNGSLIVSGRLPMAAGSLVIQLWKVVAGAPDSIVVEDAVPITGDVFIEHTLEVANPGINTTYRLRAEVTDADGGIVAFLGVLRIIQPDVDVPVDCAEVRTAVANVALGYLGITDELTALATDDSVDAQVMRRHFDGSVDEVLRAFPWGFATAYADLEYIDGSPDEPVNHDYPYAFRLPADCVMVRRVVKRGTGRSFDNDPAQFKQGANDDDGRVLFANYADPESADVDAPVCPIEYTKRATCPVSDADAQFLDALAWLLASKAAPAIARNNLKSGDALGRFLWIVNQAKVASANERQESQQPERLARWMQDR